MENLLKQMEQEAKENRKGFLQKLIEKCKKR